MLSAAQRGDRRARDRIAERKLPLVRCVAACYQGYGLPLDDLVQEGCLGLLRAIDRFDSSRGSRFDAYARTCIRRAIANALSDQARLIRLPRLVVDRRRAVAAAEYRLAADGVEPTVEAIAGETGLNVHDITEARNAASAVISLDQTPSPSGPPLEALISDPYAQDPAKRVVESDERERLWAAVHRLPERKRRLVVAQWGLSDGRSVCTNELARRMHLSAGRTQTIGRDAIWDLRGMLDPAASPLGEAGAATSPPRRPRRRRTASPTPRWHGR